MIGSKGPANWRGGRAAPTLDVAIVGSAAAGAARARRPAWLAWCAVGVCMIGLTLLFRLPFLHMPLTQDEGGYAYIARLWAQGAHLYGSDWVDRPQGLVLAFRLATVVAPGTVALRLYAAAFVALTALLVAYVGWRVGGAAVGICAGILYAVFSSGPHLEGFALNGELLANLPTAAAIACALAALSRRHAGRWLIAAGLCSGVALTIKQSALDGFVTIVLLALVSGDGGTRGRVRRVLYLTGRPSITPYLWRRPLNELPGAYEAVLRRVDEAIPVCVIPVQPVSHWPGDERMRYAIMRHYTLAWTGYGVAIYCQATLLR